MRPISNLIMMTEEILEILTSNEYNESEKIEELRSMGYDYDDIVELALLVEKGRKK